MHNQILLCGVEIAWLKKSEHAYSIFARIQPNLPLTLRSYVSVFTVSTTIRFLGIRNSRRNLLFSSALTDVLTVAIPFHHSERDQNS